MIHTGDAIEIMAAMPADSVDAVVTDPPYGLSSHRNGGLDCLSRIVADVRFPDHGEWVAEDVERSALATPRLSVTTLDVMDGTVGIGPGIGVPEGSVDLKERLPLGEPEVYDGHESATGSSNGDLPDVGNAHNVEYLGNHILKFRDGARPACEGACGCFTQPRFSLLRMVILAEATAGLPSLGRYGLPVHDGDPVVGAVDDSQGVTSSTAGVVAGAGTVDTWMLALDLGGGTGVLTPARRADEFHAAPLAIAPVDVGAGAGTGSTTPEGFKPVRIKLVDGPANGTLTLWLPAQLFTPSFLGHSTRSGGFMNKQWDGLGSRPSDAYRWHLAWAQEAIRVLKPGGYILAFGGTRTVHRLGCALEDAGFEPRDLLVWITASGFPKGRANLKPAHEPIVLARKPGPLRPLGIDACRIPAPENVGVTWTRGGKQEGASLRTNTSGENEYVEANPAGRWPSNLLLSDPALFDEPNPYVVGSGATSDGMPEAVLRRGVTTGKDIGYLSTSKGGDALVGYGDTGGYSRFFLVPKSARNDREPTVRGGGAEAGARLNAHPT